MKKILYVLILCAYFLNVNVFGISTNFQNLLSTMEVSRYNVQGYEINEYIYYTYNQIIYGSPELAINEPTQRWKNVETGKWTKSGVKGEYRILGYNISGDSVNNHEFPMDVIPSSSPLDWNYAKVKNSEYSWNNVSLFKYDEQKNYMRYANLYRNGMEYNLNADKIGYDKTRVENVSTWKSSGLIYTNRIDPYGKVWEATFITKPIASDVSLINDIKEISNKYEMTMFMDYIDVPIEHSAYISNINQYMNPQHVKLISTDIYIDDGKDFSVSTTNSYILSGKNTIRIYRTSYENYPYSREYTVNVKARSTAITNFITDGPMYAKDEIEFKIIVHPRYVESIYMPPPEPPYRPKIDETKYETPIITEDVNDDEKVNFEHNGIEIMRLNGEGVYQKVIELNKSNSTNDFSEGFVSAGQWIGLKINIDNSVKKVIVNMNNLSKSINLIKSGNAYFGYVQIPIDTFQTLHSWNSLRKEYGNSFSFNNILSRIKQPYEIEFEVYREIKTEKGTITVIDRENVYLDIFERWDNLYNRDITPYILNKTKKIYSKGEWEAY